MTSIRALPLMLLLLLACAFALAAPTASEDVAVLSTIIQEKCAYAAKNPEGTYQVVPDETAEIQIQSFPKEFDASTVKSLLHRNKTVHPLPELALCSSFKRVSASEVTEAMAQRKSSNVATGWAGFHRAFPSADGLFNLSLPGYSSNGNLAIVQVSFSCGGLCGGGFYWILRKVGGKWVVQERSPAWVS